MKRNAGFALIGCLVVIVLGVTIFATIAWTAKRMVDKAKTIEAHRRQQMTNELVEPFPLNFPEEDVWIVEEATPWEEADGELVLEVPEAELEGLFESVGDYRIDSSWTPQGPWMGEDVLTGSKEGVRQTLLELLRVQAAKQPFPSSGFIRYTRQ